MYSKELDKYVGKDEEASALIKVPPQPISSTREMTVKKERFMAAVAEYEKKTKKKTGVDLRKSHDWTEVLQTVNTAREKYEGTNAKGFCSTIRNGFRSFSSATPTVKNWLQLLPKDSLEGSVLCGGIQIIFDVCSSANILA